MQSDWINGPDWLESEINETENWEQEAVVPDREEVFASSSNKNSAPIEWKRFSNFRRLRNVFARVLNLRNRNKEITPEFLDQAENRIWKLVQRESYTKEIASLKKGDSVKGNSKIESMNPFLSENLIRAKGRLRRANLSCGEKHPVILPHSHPAVNLYLEFQHKHNHHQGVEHIRTEIQRKLWVTGLRNALRSVKHQCLHCKLKRRQTSMPMMSDLPVVRIEDNVTPFTNTGVDYFGPFSIKLFRRTVKNWICLFTCLSVRAVHMEIVQSLDTQSCLDAVHRFIARRGKPKTVISDNGTNFVGAANELKAAFKELNHSEMQRNLAQNDIKWTFNPPAAPYFGGAWESLVKLSKRSIFNILGKESLKEENLSTVICIAEQLLNNRPLTAVSSDVEDLDTITPNHFLVGGANASWPISLF